MNMPKRASRHHAMRASRIAGVSSLNWTMACAGAGAAEKSASAVTAMDSAWLKGVFMVLD